MPSRKNAIILGKNAIILRKNAIILSGNVYCICTITKTVQKKNKE